MGFLKALWNWKKKYKDSDIKYIKVNDNGSFYMDSQHLFDNKDEALHLLKELNKSLEKRNKTRIVLNSK